MNEKSIYRTGQTRWITVAALLSLAASTIVMGQTLARYTVARTTGNTYNSIDLTGSSVPNWRNSSNGNFNLDDNRSFQIEIGFDFWYRGVRYTHFSVSTNGFIDFSSSTALGGPDGGAYSYVNAQFSGTTGTLTALAPFYDDLTTDGGTDPLGDGIKYSVTGVAPNRVLTVEWISMAVYGNTTPDLNFQAKLYESSGVIEYNYSTMNQGTFGFTYTIGINGPTMSGTAQPDQLQVQQTANTATFSATETHNLVTMPASGSRLTFTPPDMNAPHTLTFTGVSQTGMTLNWVDTLWNEVGFAVYGSDDGGATYNFLGQTAANATSYAATGLLAGTTYYFKVYAVNEGRLSTALAGNQATLSAGAPYTITSGSWKNPAVWSTSVVPGISDNATIADGTVIVIDSTVTVNSLTVGQGASGTLLIGDDNTARSITVIGNVTVNAGAVFRVNGVSNTSSHTLTVSGNIANSGRFVMATDADSRCAVTFNKNGTQTVNGNGDSTRFYLMTLNMGTSRSNILDIFATNFSVSTTNFLTLTNGTFNLATGASVTPFTAAASIPSSGGIRVNHASASLSTTGGSLTVAGEFRVQAGTVTIGNNTGHNLISSGGAFTINGGTVLVRGGFIPNNAYVITDLTMTGGTMIVADSGSTSATYAPFNISLAGSNFVMSGGTIIVKKEGGTGAEDLGFVLSGFTSYSVTGGTVQIGYTGLTPAAQTMRVNVSIPVYNFVVNSSNATAQLITNGLTVLNDLTITAGTLNANGLDIGVARHWENNSQTFTPGAGKVTFNGTGAQSVIDPSGETFNKLTVSKSSGTLTLQNSVTVSDSFAVLSGTMDIQTNTLTLNGNVSSGGTVTSAATGTINYNQSSNGQTVLAMNYGNLTFSNFTKILPAGVVGVANVFTSGSAAGHTITGNTMDFNGSGAQNIPSFLYNNLTLSTSGTKTQQSGADTVTGTLTIGGSVTLTVSSADTMRVLGNVINNGTQNGTNYLDLSGSTAQSISGGGSFTNLKVNNANGITLTGNMTINGTLRLLNGNITNASDTVIISSSGTVSRNSGHVTGWLKKSVGTGSNVTVTYEIGTGNNYTPAQFVFASVSVAGTLTVSTVAEEHPESATSFVNPADNVNRYWQTRYSDLVYNTASGYNLTLTYVAGDCDIAGSATFRMNWYNGSFWDSTTAGTRTTTTNQALGIDSLGIYIIGLRDANNAFRSKGSGTWNDFTNVWERFDGTNWVNAVSSPVLASGQITIRNGHTVTVTTNLSGVTNGQDQIVVEEGGTLVIGTGGTLQIRNGAGTDLTVYGTVKWDAGTFSVNGGPSAVYMSGGKYIHDVNGSAINVGMTTTWNANSTVEITGTTNTVPTSLAQTFGNFVWNNAAQSAVIALAGNPVTVNGNFEVLNTNGQQLLINNNTAASKTIGGSFKVEGTSKVLMKQTGATAYTVTIGDSLVVRGTGSTLRFVTTSTAAVHLTVSGSVLMSGDSLNLSGSASVDSLKVGGNFTHTSGVITETSTGSGTIVFNGTSRQVYTSGGTVSNTVNYRVHSGSWLAFAGSSVLSGGGSFTLLVNGTLESSSVDGITSAGATGNVQVTGTRTYSSLANYIFAGSALQSTGVFTTTPTARTVNKLEINNSAGVNMSDSLTVTDSLKLVAGNLGVGTMTLYIANATAVTSGTISSDAIGTVNYSKGSNGQNILPGNYGNLILSNFNKTFPSSVGIASVFTPGTATGHTLTGNTIDFNGTSPQTVNGWAYYQHLTVSGSNWKKLSGNATVNGNLSISGATLSDSIYTLTVKGNISNNTVNTGSGTGKTLLAGGSSAHQISGGGSFRILELNDINGATVNANFTVDSILVLTSGVMTTGSNVISCSVFPGTSRTAGHVHGFLQKTIGVSGSPQTYTFQVGDATNYTPVELTFQSVSVGGTVMASQTAVDHPQVKYSGLDEYKDVNRFYTLSGAGLTFSTYDATFNFVAGDIDAGANTAYFFVKRYNTTWSPSTINVRNSTSTKTTGITGFGDFAVGEASLTFYWTKGAGTYNWGDDYNWSSHSVPTSGNHIVFDGKDTITVNVDAYCNDLIVHNDTARVTILAGKTLSVSGNFTQYSGIVSTRGAFPTVAGTVSLVGGTFGYDSSGGTQTVTAHTYHSLRISGGGTKTAAAGMIVDQNLTIGAGATFADGGFTITVKDSIQNDGAHTGAGKILFNGTSEHRIAGTGSFTNMELNNTSNGITLSDDMIVNGVLTLTNGIVTATSDSVTITSTGSLTRTSGYVNGFLKRYFTPGSDSITYAIGSSSNYLPVTISFGTVSNAGYVTAKTVNGDHPDVANAGVFADSTVNRYWIVINNGTVFDSYNMTVNWIAGDVDAGISDFSDMLVVKKDNGVWSDATVGVITSTSVRAMNVSSFSEFAVGKGSSETYTSVVTGNWSTAATWDLNKVPKKRDKVFIVSPHIVSLVDDREITNVSIASGAELSDGGYRLDLYGNFAFSGQWSGSGQIRWNDSDQDTLSGTGGKTTGTSTLFVSGTNKVMTATNDTLYRVRIGSGNTVTNSGSIAMARLIGDAAGSTWINGSGAVLAVSDTLLATGTLTASASNNTVNYFGTGAQSVKANSYVHLGISGARGNNSVTLPNGTISVSGTFTPTATFTGGSYVRTGNTIEFNGAGAQTVPAFDYHNMTISGARGGNTVTMANSDTIGVAGSLTISASSVSYAVNGSIVDFNGSGAQTIPAFSYHSLRISGARTTNSVTLVSGDTISVADSLNIAASFTSGGYIVSGSKIAYNGTGAQTIVPFAYHHLSISGARGGNTVVVAPSDTVRIAGTLAVSMSGGTLSFTNSAVDFNGTGAQTIPAFAYHTLKLSGSRGANAVTLASGTIGIAEQFIPAATFSGGEYVVSGSTIEFSGSGAQSIPAFLYNNLHTATGGTKTIAGALRIMGNVTVGAGTTLNAGATTDTVYGHWTTTGSFAAATSKIVFAGGSASTITGATTFYELVVNKTQSATTVTAAGNIQTVNVDMNSGTISTGANTLTITGTRTGNGIIFGTVTRTHVFALSTPYAFEGPNTTIVFTAGTPPSSVTMTVASATPASPTFVAVDRTVNIAITGGSGLTSTLRLHYENSEANSLNETLMKLWQYGTSWQNRNATSFDSVANYVESSGLTSSIVGDWGIGSNVSSKTVSDINGGTAHAGDSLLYTISITNPYNVTKGTIVVTDPLDDNLILKSGSISNGGNISGRVNNGNGSLVGGTVTWPSFSLASGASTSRTFTANTDSLMDVLESIANTAQIDFGGSNVEDVSTSIAITNIANISIDTNVVSHQNPVPGDTLVYTLKYSNNGTSNATSVSAVYTIPANTTFLANGFDVGKGIEVNGTAKTNASDGDEVTVAGTTITVTFATVSPGSYKQIKFKTIVN